VKLLLVDDSPIFLEGLTNLLRARGMSDIATAGSGREAMQKAEASLPDVVLMDTQMKPLSGYDAARLMKAEYPGVKIIMMTGSETEYGPSEPTDVIAGFWNKSTDASVLLRMLALVRGMPSYNI